MNNAVIAPAAHGFFNRDYALALFHNRSGICVAARAFLNGQRFAGHRSLVYHSVARDHLAVKRYKVARAHYYFIPRRNIVNRYKYFLLVGFKPNLVYIKRHSTREVGNGLFMSPFLKQLAQPQHKHNGRGGIKITPQKRYGNCRGVKHRYGKPALYKRL